jgi:DNA-binding LacI/PurR family transcriptional regulator
MRSLLEKGLQPDAVFAANDLMALGALHVLHQAGIRVPEEIAVIGFDDIDDAEFAEPPLTTVHQPTYDIGRHAAELLLMHIDQQALTPNHMILPCTFVRRFSA